jgi:Na+-transporting methylmalonyl-CoA/oxaloacetate decarboxylase gamma subunit
VINLNNNISLGDSLIITVFSMVTVFVTLYIISLLIDLLRIVTNKDKKEKEINKTETLKENIVKNTETPTTEENLNQEELVAVIAASIAASLGVTVPDINIKSIKRVSQPTPLWAQIGRREQLLKKL